MKRLELFEMLKESAISLFVSVPDSTLKPLLGEVLSHGDPKYIACSREEEAIGIASGYYLAGKKAAVLMQNAGLGSSLGAIMSLVQLYQLPLLMIIGWRGDTVDDAPEHILMGKSTLSLLEQAGIKYQTIEGKEPIESIRATINEAYVMGSPIALVIRRGALE